MAAVLDVPLIAQSPVDSEVEEMAPKDDALIELTKKIEALIITIEKKNGNGSPKAPLTAWISVGAILIGAILSVGVMSNKLDNAIAMLNQTQSDLKVERERVNELRLDVARSNAKNEEILKQVTAKGGR